MDKNNQKETNFLLIVIIILIVMVIVTFSGFLILFMKYLNINSDKNIQNTSVEYKDKNDEINKKSESKEEIKLKDGITLAITNELISVENSLYELIKMYLNYEISKFDLGNSITIAKESMQKIIDEGTIYSSDPNIYTKAVDEYTFKLNELILNLDNGINNNDLSYIEDAISDLKQLSELKTEIFLKRIEYLKENGFSDDEIHYLD